MNDGHVKSGLKLEVVNSYSIVATVVFSSLLIIFSVLASYPQILPPVCHGWNFTTAIYFALRLSFIPKLAIYACMNLLPILIRQ